MSGIRGGYLTGLITVRDYDECRAERTDIDKAEKLMTFVERSVRGKAANLYTFLAILENIGQTAVASRVRGMVPKPSSHSGAATTQPQQPPSTSTGE